MIAVLYSFHKMTEKDAIALCSWKYEPPYDLFNFKDWDTMVAQAEEFGDPRIRDSQYRCVRDQQEALAGYVQFFPIGDWIRLGLGLRPDLCGQSFGLSFVEAAVLEASRLHPHARIDLEVLTWNERAIQVYINAGFVIRDCYVRPTPTGPGEFYCMELDSHDHSLRLPSAN